MTANFMSYLIFFGAVVVGWIAVVLIMYWIYRRGVAIRLTVILMSCVTIAATVSFMLGNEGITLIRVSIALVTVLPILIGLFLPIEIVRLFDRVFHS